MNSVIASAPAKINWTLAVTGLDEKGYHLLDMLMQTVSIFDTVTVSKAEEITVKTNKRWLPVDEHNTAFKAAKLFFEQTGIDAGCDVFIKKMIPSGAGLAGGSADGAATLAALNVLFEAGLTQEELSRLALKIGADVPFMLKGGLCRARGIGEQLEKINAKQNYALLCVMNLRQPASTPEVYKKFDTLGSRFQPDNDKFISALNRGNFEQMNLFGGNMLTESACTVSADIEKNIGVMKQAGAKFVSMSGSGATVYGVFETLEQATEAKKYFPDCWAFACRTTYLGIKVKENK